MANSAESNRSDLRTVAELLVEIRRWPLTFVAAVVLTTGGILAYAFLSTPEYKATVKLMPRENEAGGGLLQSALGQFSGLASMAGLSLGSVNEQEAIALLKSRSLFTKFAEQEHLLPILFSKQWDASQGRWRPGLKHLPTIEDAWLKFDRGVRRVTYDPKSQLITLDVIWVDPARAAAWANELARLANEDLRQRALRESAASIESYREQIARADAVELRQALAKLLEIQLNRSAMAKSRLDYALTVIDPAFVADPKHFEYPRRFLLLLVSGPVGLVAGAAAVLLASSVSRARAEARRLR